MSDGTDPRQYRDMTARPKWGPIDVATAVAHIEAIVERAESEDADGPINFNASHGKAALRALGKPYPTDSGAR